MNVDMYLDPDIETWIATATPEQIEYALDVADRAIMFNKHGWNEDQQAEAMQAVYRRLDDMLAKARENAAELK